MIMGPGVSLTGDILWDKTQARPSSQKLDVQLNILLSSSETATAAIDIKAKQEALVDEQMSKLQDPARFAEQEQI